MRYRKCGLCQYMGFFQKNKKSKVGNLACSFCNHYSMGSSLYVILLGLIGTVITAFDIVRIIKYQSSSRRYTGGQRGNNAVPQDVERDLKLMTSILGIEHYTQIMLGAITEYPMLHIPWLLMQLCVIIVEICVFLFRLVSDGLYIKRDEIPLAIWVVHNWLQKKTLYIGMCWLVVSCLSSITLEVGARSPLGHSVTKSAAFNAIFRRNYNTRIYMQIGSFIASILSTGLIIAGQKSRNPFLHVPWLINTMRGMFLNEAPAFFNFTQNQLPYAPFAAMVFAFIITVLFVEELFIWWEAYESFLEAWEEYMHRGTAWIQLDFSNVGAGKTEDKLGDNIEGDESLNESEDASSNRVTSRRTKSLTSVNCTKKHA